MLKQNKKIIILLLALLIAIISFLVYSPTFKNDFVWDDLHFTTNPALIGSNPYSFFLGGGVYYRPILHLSVVFDYSIWHLNPFGYHLTNMLLHTVCSLFVFLVSLYLLNNSLITANIANRELKAFKNPVTLSFIAALLFALHPIHTESVAWINGRTDILATLFFLPAFLSFLIYVKEERKSALILCSFFFLLSLFSKENGIALIGVVLVYGIITGMPKKKIILTELALFAGLIIYLLLRGGSGVKEMTATAGSREAFFSSAITPGNFFKDFSLGTGYYFERLVFPFNLSALPRFPEHPVYYLIFLAPFIIGAILYFKGKKLHAFLIAWIVITLLPSLSILFSQIAAPVAERYLYLPSVGFAILLGLLFGRVKSGKIALISVLSVLSIYSFTTFNRLGDWKNDLALWKDASQKNPDIAYTHTNYASALIKTGELVKAKEALITALKIDAPISFEHTSKILELLGVIETKSGDYQKAEDHLINAIKANEKNKNAFNNLGFLYAVMAQESDEPEKNTLYIKSIKAYENALRLSPGFIQPKFNIALSYLNMGNYEKATEYFNSVIKSDPVGKMSAKSSILLVYIEKLKAGRIKDI